MAALLRRVAVTLDGIPGAVVQDLVLHNEIAEDGDTYSLTVYYSMPELG